jgi:8-oxo-dGTP pyrophosphatase MutT (NUDIX family)
MGVSEGWIDPGETAEQAAVREVREEGTGLRADIVQLAGTAPYVADGRRATSFTI